MNDSNVELMLGLIKESDICGAIIDLAKKKPWPDPIVDEITKDVTWLIEQAERAQEMENNCKALTIEWRDGVLENKRLRDALNAIAWNVEATSPQAMIMQGTALKALKGGVQHDKTHET